MSKLLTTTVNKSLQPLCDELKAHLDTAKGLVPDGRLLDNLMARMEKADRAALTDEALWTFLFACGYAIGGNGFRSLFAALTDGASGGVYRAMVEAQPIPPRSGAAGRSEGNSNIDLLVGSFCMRAGTASGVCASADGDNEVCFVEAKLLSDIAHMTYGDLHRNQLVRVIENALTFQTWVDGACFRPKRVHVTLLTPSQFRDRPGGSRFYYYKFHEYQSDPSRVLCDTGTCKVDERHEPGKWKYPDITERLPSLDMHWVTHEELLRGMPGSQYRDALITALQDLQSEEQIPQVFGI